MVVSSEEPFNGLVWLQTHAQVDVGHSQADRDTVSHGGLVPFDGVLMAVDVANDAIEEGTGRMSGSAVLKVMRLRGAFCCPSLSVNSKSVELGKVGCAGHTAQRSFDVEVVNECDLRLPFCIVDQPKALVLTHGTEEALTGEGSTSTIQGQRVEVTPALNLWIEPRAQFTLRCSIRFRKEDHASGTHETRLRIANGIDRTNVVVVSVSAELVVQPLKFSDHMREPLMPNDQVILLPPLTVAPGQTASGHSSQPSTCNTWFSVRNAFDQPLTMHVAVEPAQSLVETLRLGVVARESNTMLKQFTLDAHETIDIRVVCDVKDTARLTQEA